MSANVVADKTINRIVTFMLECDDEFDHNPLRSLSIQKTSDRQTPGGAARIGRLMRALNTKAVRHCYKDSPHIVIEDTEHVFTREGVSLMQAIKSMSCWFYQCNEGDSNKDPLYTRLSKFHDELTHHAVHSSKEWEAAEWG